MRLYSEIAGAAPDELELILQAVRVRYCELYPDWELNIFSFSIISERNEQIDRMISVLEKLKT